MSKQNLADAEADAFFALRERLSKSPHHRAVQLTLAVLLSCFLLVFGALIYLLPQKSFSENENRLLSELPSPELQSIVNGRYTAHLADFYSDQFPFRDAFISAASYCELLLGRREANDVVLLESGALAERKPLTLSGQQNLTSALNAIEKLRNGFSVDSVVAIVPDSLSANSDDVATYSITENDSLLYLSTDFEGAYFKGDHHLTAYGAYKVYCALGTVLGYEPCLEKSFSRETVSTEFFGTAWSRSGLYMLPGESLELWRYNGDELFSVSGDLEQIGFYDFSKLAQKDKYSVFLSGNHGHIEISAGDEKPRLLVIKDSFANALIPFLAKHFELCVVDPRYFSGDLTALADSCARVLFFYGINSLVSDRDLVRLTLK